MSCPLPPEPVTFVSVPADTPGAVFPAGFTTRPCAGCGVLLALAPSTMAIIRPHDETLCIPCAQAKQDRDGVEPFLNPGFTPEQRAEIAIMHGLSIEQSIMLAASEMPTLAEIAAGLPPREETP